MSYVSLGVLVCLGFWDRVLLCGLGGPVPHRVSKANPSSNFSLPNAEITGLRYHTRSSSALSFFFSSSFLCVFLRKWSSIRLATKLCLFPQTCIRTPRDSQFSAFGKTGLHLSWSFWQAQNPSKVPLASFSCQGIPRPGVCLPFFPSEGISLYRFLCYCLINHLQLVLE